MMKRYLALVFAAAWAGAAMMVRADSDVQSEVVDGVTWYYRTSQQWNSQTQQWETYAYITSGADKYTGNLIVPSRLGDCPVKSIGGSAFSNCSGLTSVTIPEGVTSIGYDAFYNCSGLTSVTIPEGVTSIDEYAFSGCSGLTSVTMPSSVTSIGNGAFRDCSGLASVIIPEGVTSFGYETFCNCGGLTSVTIPESVTCIGYQAFYNCSGLTSVTIPSSVTSIGNGAFCNCSGLTAVTIPEGVTSIGSSAFYNCSGLARFDVPASVTSIGNGAVHGCDSLRTITVADGNVNYRCVNNCIVSASGTTLIAVPFGCEEVAIPEGVTSIDSWAFDYCRGLTTVTIPSSVTSIGEYAFYYCSGLTSVTIPSGVTSIGSYAFCDCSGLTSVTIPSGVRSIGEYAFSGCSGLKDVTFLGAPPTGVSDSGLLWRESVSLPRLWGSAWLKLLNDINKFQGYNRKQPDVAVLTSKIRENDPTILDVVYKVTSSVTNVVKVRVLAFEDGVRSFANIVRPETFVADTNGVETAGNIGDAVAANVEHTLSWKVSADWSNQLAKVSFEVLATEGDLLPLEVRTIPASDQYGKMDVTWNAITESQWFDALLWLYADNNLKVSLLDGVYYYDGKVAAKDAAIYYNKTANDYYSRTYDSEARQYVYVRYKNAPEVVLEEMGYTLLSGDVLDYVNEETRLGLVPSGARQYGYRIVGE